MSKTKALYEKHFPANLERFKAGKLFISNLLIIALNYVPIEESNKGLSNEEELEML